MQVSKTILTNGSFSCIIKADVRNGVITMSEEYGNNLVSVLDDEGNEHQFEVLDAIETDDGRDVALLPIYSEAEAAIDDDGELVILAVEEENGEELLVPILDDEEFEQIASIFEERLSEYYEINEVDEDAPSAPLS